MRKLVRYDVYRAFHQASTYVLLAITLVLTVFTVGDVTFFSEEPSSDLVFTYGSALASGKNILLMLAGCLCGMLIGEDFSVGSYSLAVSSGYSRWKIVGDQLLHRDFYHAGRVYAGFLGSLHGLCENLYSWGCSAYHCLIHSAYPSFLHDEHDLYLHGLCSEEESECDCRLLVYCRSAVLADRYTLHKG